VRRAARSIEALDSYARCATFMKMNKFSNTSRLLLLSATNGLFSSSVLIVLDRVHSFYTEQRFQDEMRDVERIYRETGTHIQLINWQPVPFWWVKASGINLLMFVIAGFIVHRFLAKHLKSVFLLWQVVGVTVIFEWALTFITVEGIHSLVTQRPFQWISQSPAPVREVVFGFIVSTIAINIVYGVVIQVSAKYYSTEKESECTPDNAV